MHIKNVVTVALMGAVAMGSTQSPEVAPTVSTHVPAVVVECPFPPGPGAYSVMDIANINLTGHDGRVVGVQECEGPVRTGQQPHRGTMTVV